MNEITPMSWNLRIPARKAATPDAVVGVLIIALAHGGVALVWSQGASIGKMIAIVQRKD